MFRPLALFLSLASVPMPAGAAEGPLVSCRIPTIDESLKLGYASCGALSYKGPGTLNNLPFAWWGGSLRANCDAVRIDVFDSRVEGAQVLVTPLREGQRVGKPIRLERVSIQRGGAERPDQFVISYWPYNALRTATDSFTLWVQSGKGSLTWQRGSDFDPRGPADFPCE